MENILSTTTIFTGKMLSMKEAEIDFGNGNNAKFEYATFTKAGKGVMIVPMDKEGNIFFIEHFFIGPQKRLWVFPGGGVEIGVLIEEEANRELQEEIGMKANKREYLTELHAFPGYIESTTSLFLATDLEPSHLEGDEIEEIIIHKIPLTEALKKILAGEITDARTIAALFFIKEKCK